MIGSTFSHYRIVRKIGEGGMGEVFLAEDLKLRRTVALKFLATRLTLDPDRKERFLQEARAAAQTPGLDVISTRKIEEVLADADPEPAAEASARLAEAARRAGAGAVVTGSIYKAGSELRLDVRVEDLESRRLLSAESVRGTDAFQLVDELTARVRESLRKEPARHQYQRFLELWKDADPALPELREAKEGAQAKKE